MTREHTLEEIAEVLRGAKSFVLTGHENPDGDCTGSTLGLTHILRSQGKEANVIIDDKLPRFLSFLPGAEGIRRAEEPMEVDVLLVLDTVPTRIGRVLEQVKAKKAINIDHHETNDGSHMDHHIEPQAAATAEVIYKLVKTMGVPFTKEAAMCLYTGLATDTGYFRYANTTPFTMRAGADLIEAGAVPYIVSEAVDERPYQAVVDLASALSRMECFAGGKACGIFLDAPTAAKMETTEGFIDSIRIIEGVDIAVVLKMKEENLCRVSMRSKRTNVTAIATQFEGGGHVHAAGCTLHMGYAEAKKTIMEAITRALEAQA